MPQPGHRSAVRTLLAALAAVPLCSCASVRLDTIQVGPWFGARPVSEVAVFASRTETKRPWGAIGIIHGPRVAASDGKKIEACRRQAAEEAARMGADGLILTVEAASDDGQLEVRSDPEVFVSGLAIRYVPDAIQPDQRP